MIRIIKALVLGSGVALTAGSLAPASAVAQTPPGRQQALARDVRQAFAGVIKRQLGLNADQARRLREVDDRYQKQRNELGRDERDARAALRRMLEDTTATPDQAKVDESLSRLVKAQRRRADILEAEQKDLSAFLTPVQRAKFFALRDQLNRRIAQLRPNGTPPAGRRGGRPPQR